jgi:hypothetical protein
MRNSHLMSGWVLVVSALSVLTPIASAQDTSTPEERMQWVEVTHKLESAPLDDSVNKQGEAAFKRLSDVHDVHVLLCPALLSEFKGGRVPLTAALHGDPHARERSRHPFHPADPRPRGHQDHADLHARSDPRAATGVRGDSSHGVHRERQRAAAAATYPCRDYGTAHGA